MELIQNSVYNREGKKWKQRWAILKKVSPSTQGTSRDAFYYLCLYKDDVHAKEEKEKYVLPLKDFCGLESLKQYDKTKNVLVLITAKQTAFLSFEDAHLRDQWIRILLDHFGEAVTFDITIPDKQKLKAGLASLRLYPSFFSIIMSKHYRCVDRWYTNDILRYSAENETQFVFEIGLASKKSRGLLVNLQVSNADAISKKFAEYENNDQGVLSKTDFHGSSLLDELEQAKRNAGDQNFVRRAILRASDRMRKKIRDRSRTTPSGMKKPRRTSLTFNDTMTEKDKYHSIDRKKSPDIGINLNDSTKAQVNMIRSVSVTLPKPRPIIREISLDEPAPQLPKKRSPNQSVSSQASQASVIVKKPARTLLKPRSKTTSDIPITRTEETTAAASKSNSSRSVEQLASGLPENNVIKPTEIVTNAGIESNKNPQPNSIVHNKTNSNQAPPKKGADSLANSMYKPHGYPAKYAISKTKRPSLKSKSESQKTPTPPPRSPVSLGFPAQPNVFDFSSPDCTDAPQDGHYKKGFEEKPSFLTEIDMEVKRRTIHSEDYSDDAFTYSSEPSPAISQQSCGHYDLFPKQEPAYGNIETLRKYSSDETNSLAIRKPPTRWRRGSTKHLSDPSGEQWTTSTGDSRPLKTLTVNDFRDDQHDYLNIKGTQNRNDDSDHDSYVNVSLSGPGKPGLQTSLSQRKKKVPEPLRLPSHKNDFEKYDDDDASIYHPVGVYNDNDSNSSTGCISYRIGTGSFEDMNTKIKSNRNHSDYLNLISPSPSKNPLVHSSKLNYVQIGSTGVTPGHFHSKSLSTSPIRSSARSPDETYNQSDYTRIDDERTAALNKSTVEHRNKLPSGNKTPTKPIK